jgi:hypothetical protein
MISFYNGITPGFPPELLTAEFVDSVHLHANVTPSVSTPSIMTEFSSNPAGLANLGNIKCICCEGRLAP